MQRSRSLCVVVFCYLTVAGLWLHGAADGQTPSAGHVCEPAAEVRQALSEVSAASADLNFTERREQQLTRLRSLLGRFPEDLFVHLRYQDAARMGADADVRPLQEQYQKLLTLHPREPIYMYLYGRLLVGRRTGEAKALFEQALRARPDFAWSHLGLVDVYQTPKFDDKTQGQAHLSAFMQACPASLQSYDYQRALDNPVLLRASARRLRARLESDADFKELSYYGALWEMEFRASPPTGRAPVRARVTADLTRLREAVVPDRKLQLLTLRDGYRRLGNTEQARWAEDELVRLFPQSETAMQLTMERWRAAHPPPDDAVAPEQARAYYAALLSATGEWVRAWPDNPFPWLERMSAISQLGDVPAAEVEHTADNMLRVEAASAGSFRTAPPVPMLISELYLKYNLRLSLVPELVRRGLQESEQRAALEEELEPPSPEFTKYARRSLRFMLWRGLVMKADANLRLKQPLEARGVLEEMSARLERQRLEDAKAPGEKEGQSFFEASYWEWQGRLAEAENRKLEALLYYQQVLAARASQAEEPASEEGSELVGKMRQLWRDLGGTDEGWTVWAKRDAASRTEASAQPAAAGEQAVERLPEFVLRDLQGHTWRLADLRGKVVFINIWATWCKPCERELPLVQQLHETLKARPDAVLLTLNIDSEVGLVEPYMKTKGYTFPVLPAHDYVQRFRPDAIIPRTWVVSPTGVLRTEEVGFGRASNTWLKRALDMIQTTGADN